MRKTTVGLAIAALVLVDVGAASAQQASGIIQVGDASMGCQQLVATAQQLEEAMGGAPESGFNAEWAGQMATSVAIQGAIMSGAGSMVPGLGLLGNAVGAANRRNRERREAERLVSTQRWYYLNGLYVGRDCDAQLRAQATPAAAPVTSPSAAAVEVAPPPPPES